MESIFGSGNGIHEDQSEDSGAECGKDKIAMTNDKFYC